MERPSRHGSYGGGSRGYGRDHRHGGGGNGGGGGGGYGGRGRRDRYDGNHGGGASHLARIHGTEDDRVNCPFYFKIGACRHGDRCSRTHHRPVFSQTMLIMQMYRNPTALAYTMPNQGADDAAGRRDFEDFYIEVFEELGKYGELEDIMVCDNLGDHLVGNVYAKFYDEQDCSKALNALFGRYYEKRQMNVEFSPVTDFREARCRQYDEGKCERGPFCNFMHVKVLDRRLKEELVHSQPHYKTRSAELERSSSSRGRRHRDRSRSSRRRHSRRDRSRSSGRRRKDDRKRGRSRDGRHRGGGGEEEVPVGANGGEVPPPQYAQPPPQMAHEANGGGQHQPQYAPPPPQQDGRY